MENYETKVDPTRLEGNSVSTTQGNDPLQQSEENKDKKSDLLYGIDDVPPWYMCIFLGFQVSLQFFYFCFWKTFYYANFIPKNNNCTS